jgi:hypothetical protein
MTTSSFAVPAEGIAGPDPGPEPVLQHPGGLEEALAALEREAERALRALGAATREAKRVRVAAQLGDLRAITQALEAAVRLADEAASSAAAVRDTWHFDAGAWFASGDYTRELVETAASAGVEAFELDGRILCYPAIVEVAPSETAVVIDKRRDRRARPSVVVARLAALQQRGPRLKHQAFLDSLAAAYDLVVASKGAHAGAAMRVVDVHRVLTLLPGASRDYPREEFARDLYLLDQSGLVVARDGRVMSLPGSAMTRSGPTLTTVTRTGQTKVYAGIAFREAGS